MKKISEGCFLLEKKRGVPVKIFATEKILKEIEPEVFLQAENVSLLPGLAGDVCLMPDAHSGYGAPIGTVFAMDSRNGYISPGAVGYDINCGVRLLTSNLTVNEVLPVLEKLINYLYDYIPAGVGRAGFLKVDKKELKKLVEEGVVYLVKKKGIGWEKDIEKIEEKGAIKGANFSSVSNQAVERGISQFATLGSGNHYLEVQKVEKIFDEKKAKEWGINKVGQITIMIHCGSRGFGHQICTDYLRLFEKNLDRYQVKVEDRQLACLPIESDLGKNYFQAMACAANFAFVNREAITHQVRKVFEKVFGKKAEDLDLNLVYDVCHNIAKFEDYQEKKVLIHRKGATRSYPDQPVIIGGSMETGSYLLVGQKESLKKSFGSTAHGSGRTMSRAKAKKIINGKKLWQDLRHKGIYIKSASFSGLAEEAGLAYKNISEVIEAVSLAGLSKPVAYFKPIGNIKG